MKTIKKTIIKPLTSIRMIAAFWIYVYHISTNGDFVTPFSHFLYWGPFTKVITNGAYGVEIFFILSGFIVLFVYQEKFAGHLTFSAIKKFYLLRLSRIYPVHIFTLFLTWLLFYTGICEETMMFREPGSTFLNLTLMQSWIINKFISWNSPSWAISTQWFAYLQFPLFAILFSHVKKKSDLFLIFLFLTFSYHIILNALVPPFPPYTYDHFIFISPPYTGAGSLFRSTYCFIIGCILFKLFEQNFLKQINWDIIFVIGLAGLYCLLTYHADSKFEIFEMIVLITILIYALANCKAFIYLLFSNRVMVYFGKLSFAFYMIHYPFLKIVNFIYIENDIIIKTPMLHFIGCTIILLILSSLLYHFVEIQSQNYLRKKINSLQNS